MFGYYAQGIICCWWGQRSKSRSSKRSNSLDNFASNCHRDFKLRSYFSLWKAAPNMTWTLIFDLDKLSKGQNFWNITIMEDLPKYTWISCVRHNLLLAELCGCTSTVSLVSDAFDYFKHPSRSFKADRLYLFFLFFLWMGTQNRHNVPFLKFAFLKKRKRKVIKGIKQIYKISEKCNKKNHAIWFLRWW